jgi:hypothetical protein
MTEGKAVSPGGGMASLFGGAFLLGLNMGSHMSLSEADLRFSKLLLAYPPASTFSSSSSTLLRIQVSSKDVLPRRIGRAY